VPRPHIGLVYFAGSRIHKMSGDRNKMAAEANALQQNLCSQPCRNSYIVCGCDA